MKLKTVATYKIWNQSKTSMFQEMVVQYSTVVVMLKTNKLQKEPSIINSGAGCCKTMEQRKKARIFGDCQVIFMEDHSLFFLNMAELFNSFPLWNISIFLTFFRRALGHQGHRETLS